MPASNYPVTLVGTYQTFIVPVSFETNEVGSFSLPALPYRSKPISLKSTVSKTVAATNDGTIVLLKSATTLATVTVAASAALGDEDTAPSMTDTVFETTDQYKFTTAKSTAGGRLLAVLTVEVLPSH